MNYEQAVDLHERAKSYGSILGLENIQNLMHELGDVWRELKIVHIAGTNGKGSVCCFLASMLKEAGYQVGQYNSPAVFDLREVYQISGEWITEEAYADCMERVEDACKRMMQRGLPHPTVFEVETAIAFLWFYQEKCDIVLLETGMGGGTDATNLIQLPLCSVLVSISMDHMGFLGNTIEQIAEVKAGIIKEGRPVVTVKQLPQVEQILFRQAEKKHAEYIEAEEVTESWIEENHLCYCHSVLGKVRLRMLGGYQVENSALAIEIIFLLNKMGYMVTQEQMCQGLEKADWSGRFECLSQNPLFYIDGAHNVDGVIKLKQTLTNVFSEKKIIGIMGVMADKEYGKMLDIILPMLQKVYTVTPDNKRALPAEKLAQEIEKRKAQVVVGESVRQAVIHAWKEAAGKSDTMVAAFGSLYELKEVKSAVYEITGEK